MYIKPITEAQDIFFNYGDTLSSKKLNRQLSAALQQAKDSYIVAGLLPRRQDQKVVFTSGMCIFRERLHLLSEITYPLDKFKQLYGDTAFIYIEQSTDTRKVSYTFYKEAVEQNSNRLFIAVWKNEQFYYQDITNELIRYELSFLTLSKELLLPIENEFRYQVQNQSNLDAPYSYFSDSFRETSYNVYLNGICLTPILDYKYRDGKLHFKTKVSGVIRIFTHEPTES